MNRDLNALHPHVKKLAIDMGAKCKKEVCPILITETKRGRIRQNYLKLTKKSNASYGFSYHNYGLAFDFVPLKDGKPVWDDHDLWERCGVIAEGLGLQWGGRWPKFIDKPHCHFTFGLSITDLLSGIQIPKVFEEPDWAKKGVEWARQEGIMRKVTGEPVPDYRLAAILHNYRKKFK